VNATPAEMIDRWQKRVEPAPGEGLIYWHMLLGDHPGVVAMARSAQQRLAPFTGLHMTPLKWLHMTLLIAGSADEITGPELQQMAAAASRQLATTPPITVRLGKVLYHPEAIMLAARPTDALIPVLNAARSATHEVTGRYGRPGNRSPWTPHITVCYSTAWQPAEPIISALGHDLPSCVVQISAASLVIQRGPERLWDWKSVATVRFGAAHATTRSDQTRD
jgi:2'-5' RNA ligase